MMFFHRKRLGETVEAFLLSRKAEGCSAKTVEFYQDRLRWLMKTVSPGMALRTIKSDSIQRFLADIQGINLSKVTVSDTLNAVKIFFRWCLAEKLIAEDPASSIKKLKLPKQFPRFAQVSDIAKLLTVCKLDKFEGLRNFVMIHLLLDTGMRRSELMGLSLEDTDIEGHTAIIRKGKGDKSRRVFFGETTRLELKKWVEKRGIKSGPLFCARTGKALKGRNVLAIFERLGKRAGVETKLSPHRLRHSAATLLAQRGMNTFSLSQFLGHTHTRTTEVYMHLGGTMLAEAYKPCSPVDNSLKKSE